MQHGSHKSWALLVCMGTLAPLTVSAVGKTCEVQSGERITPVIELYTSEGCSSCPPADRWLSTLKGKAVVAQAFHVGYWDYIGWVDRFASPANTSRQREVAAANGLRNIYTPQVVRNGRDWRDYARALEATAPARAAIVLRRTNNIDNFEAWVTPVESVNAWSAYWTVTEHGHSSRVQTGENAGETLRHDFVVRQYTPVGRYQGAQLLRYSAISGVAAHARQINIVVFDPKTAEPLQGVSLSCD